MSATKANALKRIAELEVQIRQAQALNVALLTTLLRFADEHAIQLPDLLHIEIPESTWRAVHIP